MMLRENLNIKLLVQVSRMTIAASLIADPVTVFYGNGLDSNKPVKSDPQRCGSPNDSEKTMSAATACSRLALHCVHLIEGWYLWATAT